MDLRTDTAADAAAPSPLDNAVWHSLDAAHAPLRQRRGRAMRYEPDVSVFAALPDTPTPADWDDLAALVGEGGTATFMRRRVEEPARGNWTRVWSIPVVQMTGAAVEGRIEPEAVELGADDAEEMLALVAATEPGPFGPRTVELGGYVGVRDGGRLVAMAGHRLRLQGLVEISAVCTDASHRGRGLGSRLVRHLVARAAERGAGTFLHAAAANTAAIRLYEVLGFAHRRTIEAVTMGLSSSTESGDPVCR